MRCLAGLFTGRNLGDIDTFYSIPYSRISDEFADAELLDAGEVDATQPATRDVALTVTRPAGLAAGSDAPVVVFIHGGRYKEGHHDDPELRGDSFARSGCVYVSVGYRLGFAGFAPFGDQLPSQYRGVTDCLIALEWVQRNIEYFGGDPTNVTLIGQSAGAGIALWLARKDHYRGAFRRVIALSPGYPRQGFAQREWALRVASGRFNAARALPQLSARTYRRFRTLYLDDIALGPFPFDPRELASVPILVSSTREEMYLDPAGRAIDRRGLAPLLVRTHGRRMGCLNPSKYLESMLEEDPARMYGRMLGDSVIRRWAAATAEYANGPVWMMEFTGDESLPAHHCVDLPLMFHNLHTRPARVAELLGPNAVETKTSLADHVHGLVVSVAQGAPPPWPAYTSDERICYSIALTGEATLTQDPLKLVRTTFHLPGINAAQGGFSANAGKPLI